MTKQINRVNEPGIYLSREGRLTFVTKIENDGPHPQYPCVGYIVSGTRDRMETNWYRWTVLGKVSGHETDHENDIVESL